MFTSDRKPLQARLSTSHSSRRVAAKEEVEPESAPSESPGIPLEFSRISIMPPPALPRPTVNPRPGPPVIMRLAWDEHIEANLAALSDTPTPTTARLGGHEYAATRHRFEFRQPGATGPTATADVAEFREGTRYSGQWMPHAVANDHEASRVSPRVEDFADTGFSEDDTRSLLIASGHEGGYNTINTYDTAGVTAGFNQDTTSSGNLQRVIGRLRDLDRAAYTALFEAYGLTLEGGGRGQPLQLRALRPDPPHELLSEAATVTLIRTDPRFAAVFIRAGQHPSFQRAQRLHAVARAQGVLGGRGRDDRLGLPRQEVIRSVRGRAILIDRQIQTPATVRDIDDVLIAQQAQLGVPWDQLHLHEPAILAAVLARFEARLLEEQNRGRDGHPGWYTHAITRTRHILTMPDTALPAGSFPAAASPPATPATGEPPAVAAPPSAEAVPPGATAPPLAPPTVAPPHESATEVPANAGSVVPAPTPVTPAASEEAAPPVPSQPGSAPVPAMVAAAPSLSISGPVGRAPEGASGWNNASDVQAIAARLTELGYLANASAPLLELIAALERFQLARTEVRTPPFLGTVIPGRQTMERLRAAQPPAGVAMPVAGGTAPQAAPSATASPGAAGVREASQASSAPNRPREAARLRRYNAWLLARDDVARTLGARDYADYVTRILVAGTRVFGVGIRPENPVHPRLLDKLVAASNEAERAMGSTDFGITAIVGQQNRPGNHAWGLAVDIDYGANPYIMNEAQDDPALDLLVEPVYERISQALLHSRSVITSSQRGERESGLVSTNYDRLAQENDAMIAYFSVLPNAPTAPPRRMSTWQADPADLARLDRAQVQRDFDLLIGRGVVSPGGDFPFAGGGASRTPFRGFLSIRGEIVRALRAQGLRWGATDFGRASGDVMHFDDADRAGNPIQLYRDLAERYRQAGATGLDTPTGG